MDCNTQKFYSLTIDAYRSDYVPGDKCTDRIARKATGNDVDDVALDDDHP